ncbi:hypothetical protein Godav_024569 [Gossypium davidsonii]|uniref:Uncharacterized protein n=1 Tax=Gossypium davidsonii TaxID=34287 RepID=A0A7J8TBX9_GOSDV|nr:hypothetical protein [Gossypium davidsonii]
MHAGERESVDSLDVRSSYLHGSIVTFGRFIKFHIGRRILSGELRSCFQMRPYIGQGSLCPQLRDWPSANSRIGVMVTKRKSMIWLVHGIRLAE